MDNIDAFIYINLDHRTDKKEQIENELAKMDIDKNKIFRISGVIHPRNNAVGCSLAHASALKFAKERGFKNFIVFEDDFQFLVDKETFYKNIQDFFNLNINYRCVMLTYSFQNATPFNDFLIKINEASNAAAYLVNQSILDVLIQYIEFGAQKLDETGMHWIFTIDQIWKKLQDVDWYGFKNKIGCQRAGFSDISQIYVGSQ